MGQSQTRRQKFCRLISSRSFVSFRATHPRQFAGRLQNDSEKAVYLEYAGEKNRGKVPTPERIGLQQLDGDGDFRSKKCIELLKQADIVVTNPPFSLFREYVAQLVEHGKKFVVIGNVNAITYKEIFPQIGRASCRERVCLAV